RSVAKRIADECEVDLGAEVGYAVRFDDKTSAATAIRLVTDGLLLAELQRDRMLSRYDTIIIDEAHERSLAIDFLLGYLKQLLPRRLDLKVIITSATIDVERFAEMFDAPVIEVSGRTFPVEVRYRPLTEGEASDQLDAIAAAVSELPKDGDILVFMSGEREIRDATDYLAGKKYPRTEILPLFGRLAAADQQKIFSSHPGRRIVLATNVAETSLTVPGIRHVIDPGFARISRFSQRLKVQRLPIEPISQASASQRAGRCGRVADGICIRLYSEEDHDGRPEFTDPEIQRTNLASVLLQMASLDLGSIRDFPFLDPPGSRAVSDGLNLLYELNALNPQGRETARLTKVGRTMSTLPTDPRLARMLIAADTLGCLADVLVIVSAMSIQDPRERPLEHQQAADEKHRRFREPASDFLSYLTLWTYIRTQRDELSSSAFRRMCRDEYLHYLRIREWQDVHSQLRRTAKELGLKAGAPGSDHDLIHRALLPGLLSHIGLREPDGREFLGARQARFMIFPGSGLAKKPPRMAMVGELVETGRLWGRTAAKIQPEWVEEAGKHLINRSYSEPHWSTRRGAVMAREKLLLYGIPLIVDRLVQYGSVDPVVSRDLFIRHALVQGEWRTKHRFFAANQTMIEEVESLEDRLRRRDLKVDDETLYSFYDERVPADVVSTRHFDSWWKKTRQSRPDLLTFDPAMLRQADAGDPDDEYPREWHSDGEAYPLTYAFEPGSTDDGVTVDVPIERLLAVDDSSFTWHVPGHRVELVTELIRSLPKRLRREFVPATQFAPRLVESMDAGASDLTGELARQMRLLNGTLVTPDDFDFAAIPAHLRVTFRVVEGGKELARGKDLAVLRTELSSYVRADLTKVAREEERTGVRSFADVGAIEPTITAGQVSGYPALVDENGSVALRVLDSAVEQSVAMVKGQARLMSFALATPVPQLGRSLDLRAKLVLSTGPHADAAAVIEECWLAALETLIVRHGGPAWDENSFDALREAVRSEAYGETERAVRAVIEVLRALGEVVPTPSTDAGEDVRVQLSWLIYPGFIRDSGVAQLSRIPSYLEAARRRLDASVTQDLLAAQDLEARYHERTAGLSTWARLAPDVQHVRWALEELRVGLLAQGLRTAFPVSVKRVTAMVDAM
ncbi:ATP-dependent RNA helicase HrpA, partial [Aeromicrobium sp.]|uniref:ATP-dependent RNA helicase HrpA n=1 Tax=Aeromicrobium sp. TaxID=1871063 RepID=UPI0019CC0A86